MTYWKTYKQFILNWKRTDDYGVAEVKERLVTDYQFYNYEYVQAESITIKLVQGQFVYDGFL